MTKTKDSPPEEDDSGEILDDQSGPMWDELVRLLGDEESGRPQNLGRFLSELSIKAVAAVCASSAACPLRFLAAAILLIACTTAAASSIELVSLAGKLRLIWCSSARDCDNITGTTS